jgi:hypothetical protein
LDFLAGVAIPDGVKDVLLLLVVVDATDEYKILFWSTPIFPKVSDIGSR